VNAVYVFACGQSGSWQVDQCSAVRQLRWGRVQHQYLLSVGRPCCWVGLTSLCYYKCWQRHLTLWRPLLLYGYSYKASCVSDRVKTPSFFQFLTSGHSDAQGWASECPGVKNYKWLLTVLTMLTQRVLASSVFADSQLTRQAILQSALHLILGSRFLPSNGATFDWTKSGCHLANLKWLSLERVILFSAIWLRSNFLSA